MHAREIDMHWYYDPILKGEYPEYAVKFIEKLGLTPDWTEEELVILKRAADKNDFIGLNYYQPQRIMKNDVTEQVERTRENSTGAPGNH